MRKKWIALCIAGVLGTQTLCLAAPEDITEEVNLLSDLDQSDILECIFIGKTLWEDDEEYGDIKESAPEMILDYLAAEGIAGEDMTSEEMTDLIDYAYELGFSSDILSISLDMMREDSLRYRDAIQNVFHQQALASANSDYLLLDTGHLTEAAVMYKDDWYGDRTDDERIALADSILEILASADVETYGYDGNTMAQAVNDLYDEDAGDNVLFLIFDVLGEQELYVTVVDSIVTCIRETFE